MDYIRQENKAILKQLRTKKQTEILTQSRQWIRSLRVGDSIETDRGETLIVVRDFNGRKKRFVNKDCVLVKRSHRKIPAVLRSCETHEDCVEIIWANNDGWKQCEFCNWVIVRN